MAKKATPAPAPAKKTVKVPENKVTKRNAALAAVCKNGFEVCASKGDVLIVREADGLHVVNLAKSYKSKAYPDFKKEPGKNLSPVHQEYESQLKS